MKLKKNKIYLIDGVEGKWKYKGMDDYKHDFFRFVNDEKEELIIRDDQGHQIKEA